MAVTNLWVSARTGEPTKRYGQGLQWRASWPGHKSQSFRTKKAAEAAELVMRTSRPDAAPSEVTVGELLDLWLPTKAGLSEGGRSAVRGGYNHAKSRWGDVLIGDVETHEVESWLATLTYERKYRDRMQIVPASRDLKGKARSALRGALQIAVNRGLLGSNPAAGISLPNQERRDPRFLTPAQLADLATAAGDYGAMIRFLGTTGLRIGECAGRVVGDVREVEPGRWRVRVTKTKNRTARDVPIPASVVAALDLARDPSKPLFVSHTGGPINVRSWRRWVFKPAAEAAGLPSLHVHDLRHTAASLMIASGADVKKVQQALGHKRASMTLDLYGHLLDDTLDDVASKVDLLLS